MNLAVVVPGVLTWLFTFRKKEFSINENEVLGPLQAQITSLEALAKLVKKVSSGYRNFSLNEDPFYEAMNKNFTSHYKDGVKVMMQNLKHLLTSLEEAKIN